MSSYDVKVDFLDIEIIENKEWNDGLGKSIAVGVATIQKNSEYNSILVMLGDQPFITSRYLDKMISKFNENQSPVIVTNYSGKPGVPALFPQKSFSELIKISGDSGAKSILKTYRKALESLALTLLEKETIDGENVLQVMEEFAPKTKK